MVAVTHTRSATRFASIPEAISVAAEALPGIEGSGQLEVARARSQRTVVHGHREAWIKGHVAAQTRQVAGHRLDDVYRGAARREERRGEALEGTHVEHDLARVVQGPQAGLLPTLALGNPRLRHESQPALAA
ncbi:MAG: hypothetical protein O9284_17765 [Steroidobacteraceae bacterium]|nr:hypothetical protein [Steroidobacteraceae bacterium]